MARNHPSIAERSPRDSVRGVARRVKRLARWLHFVHVPIPLGPLRGSRWVLSSRGKLLRILLGTYEATQTRLFLQQIRRGDVVFDVGASVGYYTLLSSKLVGRTGHVVAFEPSPENAFYLRKHVSLNRLGNVTVHEAAVGDREGTVKFTSPGGTGTGHVSRDGEVEVRQCRLDDIVAQHGVRPTHLKIDTEGAELAVLEGAIDTIERARPVIFLSAHAMGKQALELLFELGYAAEPASADLRAAADYVCHPRQESPASGL